MDTRLSVSILLLALFLLALFACASPEAKAPVRLTAAPLAEKPTVEVPMSPLADSSAEIRFHLKNSKSTARLEVTDRRRKLFMVFEGSYLVGGDYEIWALPGCRAGVASVLKAAAIEERLLNFETQYGFVTTEANSTNYDLEPGSERSLFKRKIAFFRRQKAQMQSLDCGVLQAAAPKTPTVSLRATETESF